MISRMGRDFSLGTAAACSLDVRAFHVVAIALLAATSACSSASVGDLRPDPQAGAHAVASPAPAAIAGDESPKEPPLDLLRCPAGMVEIDGSFCIDKYEASLVEVLPNGRERAFSPFATVGARRVRAVSEPDVHPQGYISAREAQRACAASGKRLCRADEWTRACRGPDKKTYGYGDRREPGRCNDRGKNPVLTLFGRRWTRRTMNAPALNQIDGTLARTGEHGGCTNGYGVFDMVGNLHEWVADARGAFRGGYYLDVASRGHGEGCEYVTRAHETRYHDYSTGFRCCADRPGATRSSR